MISLRPRHVRTRLTLWYLVVLGSVLALYAAVTAIFLVFNLWRELDELIAQDIETVETLLAFAPDGKLQLQTHQDADPDAQEERFLEVRSPDGTLLYRNRRLGDYSLGGAAALREGRDGYSERSVRLPDGTPIRLASRIHTVGNQPTLIRLARSEAPLRREFRELLSVLVLGLPLALAVAGLGGYALAGRTLAPLQTMAHRAAQITAERLNERLPIEHPNDELGQLAQVFNDTLARLERSFEQLRRFTADASHELRTPLTAIRSVGEVGLQRDGSASYYRDIIGSMLEEANRLTQLVDSLLAISRADAGHLQIHRTPVRLLGIVRESASLLEVLAEEKDQRLLVSGDKYTSVAADPLILRQALVNLIDNAIKHSPAGGTVWVTVAEHGNEAVVEVRDSGPGIAPEHQPKVFERFYRVDKARSRDAGGAGLGLSIAKWAIEAHDGQIELESEEGKGALFRIHLPMTEATPHGLAVSGRESIK